MSSAEELVDVIDDAGNTIAVVTRRIMRERKLPHRRALLIGTAAGSAEDYRRRRYDEAMLTQLVTGIMNYCGIAEAELRLLYDVTDSEGADRRGEHLQQARALGRSFAPIPA